MPLLTLITFNSYTKNKFMQAISEFNLSINSDSQKTSTYHSLAENYNEMAKSPSTITIVT